MRWFTSYLILFMPILLTCNPPYSVKLFPMEQYLQGGWYKVGYCLKNGSGCGPFDDTNTTIEVHFFKNHSWKQYYRQTNHVESYTWSFLADDSTLWRENDSTGGTFHIKTQVDTLLIDKDPYYYLFCRYYSSSLPSSWPDSVVTCSQLGPPCFASLP
jgi:hypothetical protein